MTTKTTRKPRTLATTLAAIARIWRQHDVNGIAVDGMRAPELAAVLGLDEQLTARAVRALVHSGDLRDDGARGIKRLTLCVYL